MRRFIITEADLTENNFADQFAQVKFQFLSPLLLIVCEENDFSRFVRSRTRFVRKLNMLQKLVLMQSLSRKTDIEISFRVSFRITFIDDKNRVKLCSAPVVGVSSSIANHLSAPSNDADDTRYINASHIEVPPAEAKYIAAQAPLPSTLDDWFDMIRENDVSVIVMLCKLVEGGRAKCERYWPEEVNNDKDYGRVVVTCVHEEKYDEFWRRKLNLKWNRDNVETSIEQLHFTEWPDHGCPQSEENVLKMIELFDKMHTEKPKKPVLVHCSAGCGRTGTIIAANVIREIINNQDQYQFLHKLVKRFCCDKLKEWDVEVPAPAASPTDNNIHGSSGDQLNDSDAGSTADKTVKDLNNENIARLGSYSPRSRTKQRTGSSDNDGVASNMIVIPDYPIEPDARPTGPEDLPDISS
ncbi:unnamed protein product [Anisakis simplex]|uniref:Protein-tyrosine phosphatase n=1 Tax=Anisakis simplex TaxID=6269 RepID=A0A0M3JUV2_ANISI|nr:unnamed protein product [Anisakis simplex]